MDEYFVHKCVTADAPPSEPSELSAWSQTARCELVVVQENQHACSASRAVFAAIVDRTLQSHKTSAVILLTLDAPLLADTSSAPPKLVHVDYSSHTSLARALLLPKDTQLTGAPQTSDASLLATLQAEITARLATTPAAPAGRSVVVAIDSVNALLAHHTLQDVLRFLQQLRQTLRIGSVLVRLNASATPHAVQQALAAASTAVALVETPSSLRAYPLRAKERRRDVPKNMHGLVLLLRHKKNGRSSESVDYFQIHGVRMTFVPAADVAVAAHSTQQQQTTVNTVDSSRAAASAPSARPEAVASSPVVSSATAGSTTSALPVRQEDVSFNLSISVEEQLAKSRVQLPYMHQGLSSLSSSGAAEQTTAPTNLFFIDDDDPDWDDDDLDDDLDI